MLLLKLLCRFVFNRLSRIIRLRVTFSVSLERFGLVFDCSFGWVNFFCLAPNSSPEHFFRELKFMPDLIVKSPVFEHNKPIPIKYSCDGDEVNPPITVEGLPVGATTIALVIDDPDAPRGTFDHWVVYNIPPASKIAENTVPGTEGVNSAGRQAYVGMCPPSGTHRYFFKVYALDTKLNLNPNATRKKDLEKAMQGHILARGELIGLYSR